MTEARNFPISGSLTVRDVIDEADRLFFGTNKITDRHHTDVQWAFKQKLFALASERKTKEIDECNDIDSTAFVTAEEFDELIKEARSLK